MKVNLITSCSSTRQVPPIVKVGDMPSGMGMQQALLWWVKKLRANEANMVTPREQYRGTGFMTLAKILSMNDIEFRSFIVTGGQGLIGIEEPIVPYDFTASKNEHENIHQHVTAEPFVQTVWWRLINEARNKGSTPVASQIDQTTDVPDLTLIAMPKIFLRYISDDILSAKSLDRTRIILSASSVGSVPQQLRPWIVPYDRSAIQHIPGNRNDNTHRAALMFLETLVHGGGKLEWGAAEQAAYTFGSKTRQVQSEAVTVDKLQEIINTTPGLKTLSPDEAYAVVRRTHGVVGGKMFFRGVFRSTIGETIETGDSEADQTRALEALKGLNLGTAVNSDEDETLKGVKRFADAVRSLTPKASFTAADICRWALNFYGEGKVPDLLTSPNKLAHILKSNSLILGLEPINGGKSYILAG